jgi:hypothetical protein
MKRQGSLSWAGRSNILANNFGLLLAGLMLSCAVLACNFSSPAQCTGTVTYNNQTFTGMGKDADEAQRNACNKYCLEADPEFDAHYHIWLDSPKGQAAGRPAKKEAIYKDRSLLDYVTITCMNKCVASIKSGELKGESKCP